MIKIVGAAVLALVATVGIAGAGMAKELPRRAMLGAAIAPVPAEVRAAQKVPAGQGVVLANVFPGLSAEGAGLKTGDILLVLDGKPVADAPAVVAAVRARKVGDTMNAEYLRGGTKAQTQIQLKGMPYETSEHFDTDYEAVDVGDSTRRVIITRPRDDKRHPAVLLIGGIGCYSYDAGNNPDDSYLKLLSSLTQRGFVTMRVEKSGMGDSTGAPCAQVDMQTELAGYVAGLKMLKAKPYVDARRAFIVGHSIGGVVGPLAAAKEPVRGILAMETTGLTWFEYELINTRRQVKLSGADPASIDATMMEKEWCMHKLLVERAPRAKILAEKPTCEGLIQYPASDAYMQQIAEQNAGAMWSAIKGADVAIIYGAADFVTGAEESKAIVDTVNAGRAGGAVYIEIPDMDHYLTQVASQAASFQRMHSTGLADTAYHPRLNQIVGDWLEAKAG